MFKRLTVLTSAAALALTLVPAAQAGTNHQVTLGSRAADITFASGSSSDPDNTILVHLEGLINRADIGSDIRIAVYSMTDNGRIEDALKEAQRRGVRVHVVYDPADDGTDYRDWWPTSPTTLRQCDYGCLSRYIFAPGTKMHAKFALFSSTNRYDGASASKATWVSSSNLNAGSGTEAFNNAVTYFGDSEMYSRMVKVFTDMATGPVVDYDYYRPELEEGAGHFIAEDAVTVGHVSPESKANLWFDKLAQVKAPDEGGGPCVVRVMQAYFLDDLLDAPGGGVAGRTPAHELVDLKQRGCAVAVLVDRAPDGPYIESQTRTMLCNAGIAVHSHPSIHDKVALTSSGLWYGPAGTNYPMVFTGSHNMTLNALRHNDEVLLKIYGSQGAYNAYTSHFFTAWNASTSVC